MKNKIISIFFCLSIIAGVFSFGPAIVLAQNTGVGNTGTGLVPCGDRSYGDKPNNPPPPIPAGQSVPDSGKNLGDVSNPCQFNDLLTLVSNIVNFLIVTGTAVAALSFGYAGFLMMTANGEMGKIEEAKAIFGKVMTGFIIMLSAWLIVYAIESAFLDKSFTSYIK